MVASLVGFTGLALPAEPVGDLFPLPALWDSVLSVETGGGYKDNVFLAHTAPQGSPFVSGNAEVMVMRLSPEGPQFTAFANAEAAFYPGTTPVHDEYTVFGQALLEQDLGGCWKVSFATQYFYQDQFLDVSVSETNREAVAVRGHSLTLRPGARLDLPHSFWVGLETPVVSQFFETPLDDYWEAGPKLALGRRFGTASEITVSYEPTWRFYQHDAALDASGIPIEGTLRHRLQHDVRLAWRQYWDNAKQWHSRVLLGARINQENGGGYSDHTRWAAAVQMRYRGRPWEVSLEGRMGDYDYLTQTVSATDLEKRHRTEWGAAVRVERRFGTHLTLVASYEHEQTLSNDVWETYSVNTASGAVRWEF